MVCEMIKYTETDNTFAWQKEHLPIIKWTIYNSYRKKTIELPAEIMTYYVLKQPKLGYAICTWATHTKTGIQTMEQLQCSAVHFVTGDYRSTSSIRAMCVDLIWNSLYTWRCIKDSTLFFKIHDGLMHISLLVIVTISDAHTRHHYGHKLRTLPATFRTYLQSIVKYTYWGSDHCINCRNVPESHLSSHSNIDFIESTIPLQTAG